MTLSVKKVGFFQGYGDLSVFAARIAAVSFTAVCQPLLSAPFSWWPLHWIAWIPFLWAIHAQDGKGRLFLGWYGGTFANYLIFYWIVNLLPNFSNIPRELSILLNFLLCSLLSVLWIGLAWLIPHLRRAFPSGWIFLAPAWLVALEYAMPQLFPYMQGVSHYQVVPIIQLASITGIYGVSFLLFWSNTVLFHALTERRQGRPWPLHHLTGFVVILVLVLSYGASRWELSQVHAERAENLRVALIQSNLLPRDHEKLGFSRSARLYRDMTTQAAKQGAQWVVWSEGEYKFPFESQGSMKHLQTLADSARVALLVGGYGINKKKGSNDFRDWKISNSAIHVAPKSPPGRRYDKVILVPFGEYMPFEDQLGFIYKHIRWNSRFHKGSEIMIQDLQGIPYTFLICYEAIYPSHVRKAVGKGARLLVNITYDAWFGKTTAPAQHLMLAAIRSAETGVPLLRLATTGISTTTNSLGIMQKQTPLFERHVLLQDVKLTYLPTLYTQIGDLFSLLCLASLLLAFVSHRRRLKGGS